MKKILTVFAVILVAAACNNSSTPAPVGDTIKQALPDTFKTDTTHPPDSTLHG